MLNFIEVIRKIVEKIKLIKNAFNFKKEIAFDDK